MSKYIAYIPFRPFFEPDWIGYESAFAELLESTYMFDFKRKDIHLGTLKYSIIKRTPKILSSSLRLGIKYDYILKIVINVNEKKHIELLKKDNRESIDFLILQRIQNSIIVFNIAKPSIFFTNKGVLVHKDKVKWEIDGIFHRLDGALIRSQNIKWPKIELLDYKLAWNWYFSSEHGIDDFSSNKLERAINAFSYLFDNSNHFRVDEIFWALVALVSCQL